MAPSRYLLAATIALLINFPFVHAIAAYNTNCTLPPGNATNHFYYVSSPNVRGSLQIVWSCLLTLTLCVYQVLHLNIPPPSKRRNGRDPGFWGNIKWLGCWRYLGYALYVVFAPEWVLADTINEWKSARDNLKELHNAIPATRSTWTLTHMFYVNMGGLEIMRDGIPWTLQPRRIRKAIETKALLETAPVTVEEIGDKSKSDSFTKALAMAQITYFYIDFFARVGQGLPISQLELGVAGVALFSLVMYACYWYKPKSVQMATLVQLLPDESGALRRIEEIFDKNESRHEVYSLGSDSGKDTGRFLAAMLFGALALGAIHLAAWNFEFPSTADKWIWRAASLAVVGTGALVVGFAYVDEISIKSRDASEWLWISCAVLYAIARLILFVEMIRCLFYLPPAAFETTSWTMSIPHIG